MQLGQSDLTHTVLRFGPWTGTGFLKIAAAAAKSSGEVGGNILYKTGLDWTRLY